MLRNDVTLALTAYPSSANGTSSGKSSTSPGNIFLAAYSDSNAYQRWKFIDENGSIVDYYYSSTALNGTYYINNTETGKYLHINQALSTPDAASGLISNLGNTIRWKITHLGEEEYVIQPVDDLTKYLKTISPTGTWVTYGTPSATEDIPDEYRWKFRFLRFQNVSSSMYLYVYTNTLGDYSIGVTSNTSKPVEWRIVSTERYGNTSSYEKRELTSSFSISDMALTVGEAEKPAVNKSPTDAIWADPKDFTFEYDSGSASSFSINQATQTISAICYGDTKIKATHKVTGMVKYFDLVIRHENPYTNLLINNFKFDDEGAILITKLYSSLKELYPTDPEIVISWRFSRLLGGIVYDEYNTDDPLVTIKWEDVAGDPFDIYMTIDDGTQVQVTKRPYFINYLNYTSSEYEHLRNDLLTQYYTCKSMNVCDYAHMQIALSARLAYYLDKDGALSNIYGSDLKVSYLAGWLGDATIFGKDDSGSMSIDLDNDDYLADLDAENIYRRIILNSADAIFDISLNYYNSLSLTNNRAIEFKQYISINTVKQMIYDELFSPDLSDDIKLEWLRIEYVPTYNFIMSLTNNCSELEQWN